MPSTPFHRYRIAFIGAFLMGVLCSSWSQTFGGFPAGLQWQQINTDTCRIIFPKALASQAQRVANTFHYLHQTQNKDLEGNAFKIDVVLNNQSTISNGFVAIAPWNSQLITTPLHDNFELGATPWLDLLAVHEYRHVAQLSTARRGLTKLLYYLFGQETWAGAANLALPDWYTEGDAVWIETALTRQGRGRIPSFLKGYQALAAEHSLFSYSKSRNGSIKDFVPNHYRLGYLMIKHGLENYGPNLWTEVLHDAASYKGIFYPFSRSLKKRTGLTTRGFYDQMILKFSEQGIQLEKPLYYEIKVGSAKTFTDYLHPQPDLEDGLIYYRRSFEQTGSFVRFHRGRETKLISRGRSIETTFSFRADRITWTELSQHPRWRERDYHNIMVYDMRRQSKWKLTNKGRYFSPALSSTGEQIAAVYFDESGQSSIRVLHAESGQETVLSGRRGWVFTYPQWTKDDQAVISAVRDEVGNMGLIRMDLNTAVYDTVLAFSNQLINNPYVNADNLVFSAVDDGVESVYLLDLQTGRIQQVMSDAPGAYQPSLEGDTLFYVGFTSMGHRIRSKKIELNTSGRSQFQGPKQIAYLSSPLDELKMREYPIEKYPALQRAINFHTWGFDFDDPEVIFRILSNNVLNNVELQAGVRYNYDTETYIPFANLSLGMFYPQFSFGVSGLKRTAVIQEEVRNWRETNFFGQISTDLELSSGIYRRELTPFAGISQTQLSGDFDQDFSAVTAGISFVQQRIKARKNLFTKNGQFLEVAYRNAINDLNAAQLQVRTALALPGIGVNHNLILQADHKRDQADADYEFTSGLSQRGYGVIPATRVWRLSADYHLPLIYPDWGFAGLVYLYRLRGDLFFDYSRTELDNIRSNFYSAGVELIFDVNLVNSTSTTVGLRISRRLNKGLEGTDFEVFLPIYRFD